MADINYLNPTALAPKFDWQPRNALAGMQWVENRNDYRNLFEQQMRLQQMAEEERRMELESKRKDIPLQDLQREGKIEFARGQNPLQRQVGASGAQATIATNEIAASPERSNAELSKFVQSLNDDQYKQYERSMKAAEPILSQAIALSKTPGGAVQAQQFVQTMFQRAKQSGVDLPPMMLDPNNWEPLYRAAVDTPQYRQKIGEIQEKGKFDQNVAEIHGGYSLQRAREGNASQERIAGLNRESRERVSANRPTSAVKFSLDQDLNRTFEEITNAPEGANITPLVNKAAVQLAREFDKINQSLATLAGLDPRIKQALDQNRQDYIRDKLAAIGVDYRGAPQPRPAPGSPDGQPKADPLGLR